MRVMMVVVMEQMMLAARSKTGCRSQNESEQGKRKSFHLLQRTMQKPSVALSFTEIPISVH